MLFEWTSFNNYELKIRALVGDTASTTFNAFVTIPNSNYDIKTIKYTARTSSSQILLINDSTVNLNSSVSVSSVNSITIRLRCSTTAARDVTATLVFNPSW